MIDKTWVELYNYDISKYTSIREAKDAKLEYLPWNKCILLLHELGANNVSFEPMYNSENGHSLFTFQHGAMISKEGDSRRAFDGFAPEIHVRVIVDDLHGEFSYPIINGTEVITMGKINQQLVNTARQRAFVKGVGILTGLGLKLWEKEEEEEKVKEKNYVDAVLEQYAYAVKRTGGETQLAAKLNMNKRQLDGYMDVLKRLPKFEAVLRAAK